MPTDQAKTFTFLPLTVGMETLGGIATPIVLRGSPLPAKRVQTFSTAEDDQVAVTLHFTLGERPLAEHNLTLGRVDLTGIPKQQQGLPQIQVQVEVDKGCLLHISATETISNRNLDVDLVQPELLLDENEVQRLLDEAEKNRDNDHEAIRNIEIRNEAKAILHDANSFVGSKGDREIETLVARLGLASQKDDVSEMEAATQNLKSVLRARRTTSGFGDVFSDIFGQTVRQNAPRAKARNSAQATAENRTEDSEPAATAAGQHQKLTTASNQFVELGRIFGGGKFTLDPSLCFVLMPFASEMQSVFDDHIKPVIEGESLVCVRADDIVGTQQITRDIWEHILRARFLVADLTGKNPNVFYELGLAHAIGRNVILLTQSMTDVPFDLRALRCLVYEYTPRGMKTFEQKLRRTIRELMNDNS